MKVFFNLLVCDLRRTIFSAKFLVAVFGFILTTLVTIFDELQYLQPSNSLVYIYQIIRYLDFHIVYLLFAAIPGALLFCSDWENHFIRFCIIRSSPKSYATSKAMACFISSACVVLISENLMLFLFSFHFPAFNETSSGFGPYTIFASPDKVWLFLLIKILYEALCAGFLCTFALWLSTKIINPFVVLATPIISYYLINTSSFALNIPPIFNIGNLSKGYISIDNNPIYSFFFTIFYFGILTTIFVILFVRSCRKRVENG